MMGQSLEVMQTWIKHTWIFLIGVCLGAAFVYFASGVLADTGVVRPDANGTVQGTTVGCTSSLHYECLNEVVTQPTAPSTGTDYIQFVNTEQAFLQLSSIVDVQSVTSVTLWLYHRDGGTNAFMTAGLYAANEATVLGSVTSLSSRTSAQWDSITWSSLSLTQADLDGMRVKLDCEKSGGGKSNDCFAYAMYAVVTYGHVIEATVGTTGTQQNLDIGATNAHIGGAFSIKENVSSRNVTSVTIEENGSVDANDDLKNVRLYYDLDATGADGYNCSDQTYNGTEPQFGSTAANGFSGDNGTITFTGSVGITTTSTLCLYTVLDIATTSAAGQTIEVEINNPSTDVVVTGTNLDIQPVTTVLLSGTTIIQAQDRDQIHYHWRNDDGTEVSGIGGATSATAGSQDTPLGALGIGTTARLRLEVSNEGNRTSDSTQYRLEYGRKISTCDAVTTWTDVGAGGGDFDMSNSLFLTNGNNTTDVASASYGAVTNENSTFLTPNGGVLDTSSQTGALTLTSSQFVELEYSIVATSNATAGYTYCFRLTNAGTKIETYTVFPETTILADITVSSSGTLQPTIDIPTANVVASAHFVIKDNIIGNTTIESIKLTASGTVDYNNDIDDLALWYDLDATGGDGYNCSDQSFNGNETQFGATSTNGFTSGTATFSGTQAVNTLQSMCIYVVYSATAAITDGENFDIRITDASTDVTVSTGTVAPAALVDLGGVTSFVTDITTITHYHWRNDDGSETTATAATTSEDAILENLRRTNPVRLRIGVANEGSSSTPAYQYRLEYGLKLTTCDAASYTDVGATADVFDMYNSANFTDGDDSTDVDVSQGGVSDLGDTFYANNNAMKDTSSQVAALALPGKNYTALEFSITASTTATEGATYCFRVTDAGDDSVFNYSVYPEVSIKPKTDFYIQRGATIVSGTSATINAGTAYVAPSAASNAFIRIVGTHNIGAGSPTNTGNADDVTVYISNPSNITNSITFTRPATAVDSTKVYWEIIEYVGAPGGDNEIVVRNQSTATYGGANSTVTTGAVSGIVDDADVAVFITGQLNPDTARNYSYGLSTAAWNAAGDTVTFTRGASSNAAGVSYAVVEFVGDNWKVQRKEHTYSGAGGTETESISLLNNYNRAFLHTQKRIGSGLNNHSDFGHNVYISGVAQLSFELETNAASPGSHTSVAWVIENTQNIGDTMIVSRSNGAESSGSSPKTVTTGIGATISDPRDASLFINNHADEQNGGSTQNSFPEPILGAQLTTNTQYEHWVADPGGDTRTWRAEIVEWPTAARDIEQNYYQFFANNDLLDPTDPWPAGAADIGENTEVTIYDEPIALNDTFRLRMTLHITSAAMEPGIDAFVLQYGERASESTCDAIAENNWRTVGGIGSTTALWRGTSTPLTDGTPLSTDPPTVGDLNITSVADVAGTFEEENPSALTPYVVDPLEDVEFDWAVQHNGAKEKTSYCFRMVESDGGLFDNYNYYPTIRTAGYTPLLSKWRFYDDETNATPSTPLANENASPIDIAFDNSIKLRISIEETTGGAGTDKKFKLQYSEYSDFAAGVFDVVSTTTCAAAATTTSQIWCYSNGAGVDDGVIDAAVLSDSDSCTGGVGDGCGTYNESGATTTNTTYDQRGLSTAEYEFTLKHAGARANAVYYFRLFDLNTATTVAASTSYPSVVTEGSSLSFTINGISAGTESEGVIADVDSAPASIYFDTIPLDTPYEAIYRLTIDTNATEGYQMFMYASQPMTNTYGEQIPDVTGTNASPASWAAGCTSSMTGCFGYHVGDDTLSGGSTRFAADDSYAALSTSPQEVMYSSVPANESSDIVYRIQVSDQQPAGDYEAEIVYIAIPAF